MPLSKKRDAERKRLARREARGKGRVLPGDRPKPLQSFVTKEDVREMNGIVKEATAHWVNDFLSNLKYPARPTYLVIDKLVEPATGEILADLGAMEARILALETLTERFGEHIIQLTWQVADLQADAIDAPTAEEQEALAEPQVGKS